VQARRYLLEGGSLDLPGPAVAGRSQPGPAPASASSLGDDAAWRGQVGLVEPTGADTYVVVKAQRRHHHRARRRQHPRQGGRNSRPVGQRQDLRDDWFDKTAGVRLAVG